MHDNQEHANHDQTAETVTQATNAAEQAGERLDQSIDKKVEADVLRVKDVVTAPLPEPAPMMARASARQLKDRLDWGEPGLTIIDVRDRTTYNSEHITGAIPMPLEGLADQIRGKLEPRRDIYVYGDSDDATRQAAAVLRDAGFFNVAELQGGVQAWKAIQGPVEGNQVFATNY